ncbi:MAG: branched-chain amino acid ABC transporter permease, partial [Candidatus Dormibacteria bacterium]
TTLLIYAAVDAMACLAISLQFGVSGIVNFSFIIFQAAGAYTAGVLSLPPDSANGGFQTYVLGLNLPFPVPWIGATVVAALLAVPVGLVVLRRLRSDYQAIAMLVLSVIATLMITNTPRFLDGAAGLSLVPQPLSDRFDPYSASYLWVYVGGSLLLTLLVFVIAQRIINSPYGRSLRALREHELAANALGKNSVALKMTVFVVGGAIAGLSGAILVGFITTWAPSTWLYPETLILFAAVIVGGRGNNSGAVLGALLVPVGFEEATRYLPPFGPPGLIPAFEWVCIAGLILGFLWFRPRGVFPERRRIFPARARAATPEEAGAG